MDRIDSDTPAQPPRPRRRRRWLRVLLWSGGILAAMLLIACLWHIAASHAIDSELDRLVAGYRAAGQPVLLADFDNPPIPDEQNAAKVYLAAGAAVKLEGDAERDLADLYTPLTRARMTLAKTILDRNAEALRLCHRAGTMTAVGWPWGPAFDCPWRPGFDLNMSRTHINSCQRLRTLGKLLGLAVNYHHLRGRDAAALQTLRDGFALADAQDQGHTMIDHLVALALQSVCLRGIQDILPDLKVSSSRRGAPAGQIRDLIRYLLDEQAQIRCCQFALYAERAGFIDLGEYLDRLEPRRLWWEVQYAVMRPHLRKAILRVMRMETALAEAARHEDYPAAMQALPKQKRPWIWLGSLVGPDFAGILQPSSEKFLELDFRLRVERRLAATALAMKLYERDHGDAPATLADLVNDYLPAVPSDPFDPAGGPIRYAPAARSPVLYSLGPDGEDDGGAHGPNLEVWRCDVEHYDIVFFLTEKRPVRWDPSAHQARQETTTTQPSEGAAEE